MEEMHITNVPKLSPESTAVIVSQVVESPTMTKQDQEYADSAIHSLGGFHLPGSRFFSRARLSLT